MKQLKVLFYALCLLYLNPGYANDFGIEVRLVWDTPQADLDLYIYNPQMDGCFWDQKTTDWGCHYDYDSRAGREPTDTYPYTEQATVDLASMQANPGIYTILVHHYYQSSYGASPKNVSGSVDIYSYGKFVGTFPITLKNPTNHVIVWQGHINDESTGFIPPSVPTIGCRLYAVHDDKQSDSQLLNIDPEGATIALLGGVHAGYDLESLAAHPSTHILYTVSSDDRQTTSSESQLFTVNTTTGALTSIGQGIGFNSVDSLSFDAEGQLWGWAKGKGLIQIDLNTGEGELNLATSHRIEDLTWDRNNNLLYAVQQQKLWRFDGQQTELVCTLPQETEALEMLPDGKLLFAMHNDDKLRIHALDVNTCQILEENHISVPYNDIEGLAWDCQE